MNSTSPSTFQWRLAQLAAHLVVALIALIVVGGATRVMEAGLACPDWPLCFGSFLPGRQMNVQVFLEWFHRLDAFLIGIALVVQFGLSLIWQSKLPKWIPWAYLFVVIVVVLQASLGALTVVQLLPSTVVTGHLGLALVLVAAMSAITQRLLMPNGFDAPIWWRVMGGGTLSAVLGQCILGGRMATTWSAQRCLSQGEACQLLGLHRNSSMLVAICVFMFVITSLMVGGWSRTQWPFLMVISFLLSIQITLGVLTVQFALNQPILTIAHQLIATLLVAFLAALSFRRPQEKAVKLTSLSDKSLLEPCHG